MNLVVDVGNTRVKAAVFEKDSIVEIFVVEKQKIISTIKKVLKKYDIAHGILSSVSHISEKKQQKLIQIFPFLVVSESIKVPFENKYATPKTLGVDRIALAAAAVKTFKTKPTLVIDAGTCITFEFVNEESAYLGGAISPGIKMRYHALHNFTAKLPLLEANYPKNFIGNTTNEAIHSGIMNGVVQEIEGVIALYKAKYEDLTVVLTGGDTYFLAKQLKSSIFAHPNFVLEGLHTILIYNIDE